MTPCQNQAPVYWFHQFLLEYAWVCITEQSFALSSGFLVKNDWLNHPPCTENCRVFPRIYVNYRNTFHVYFWALQSELSMTFPIYVKKGFSVSSGSVTKDENKAPLPSCSICEFDESSCAATHLGKRAQLGKTAGCPPRWELQREHVHGILRIIPRITLMPKGCDCLRTGSMLFNLPTHSLSFTQPGKCPGNQ